MLFLAMCFGNILLMSKVFLNISAIEPIRAKLLKASSIYSESAQKTVLESTSSY